MKGRLGPPLRGKTRGGSCPIASMQLTDGPAHFRVAIQAMMSSVNLILNVSLKYCGKYDRRSLAERLADARAVQKMRERKSGVDAQVRRMYQPNVHTIDENCCTLNNSGRNADKRERGGC